MKDCTNPGYIEDIKIKWKDESRLIDTFLYSLATSN